MALTTYANLTTAVAGWMNRGDLTALIPDFITLAERSMSKDLKLADTIIINAAFALTGRFTALPTDFAEMKRATLLYSGRRIKLDPEAETVMSLIDDGTGGAPPRKYCIIGKNIEIAPAVVSTLELIYYSTFPPLSAGGSVALGLLAEYPNLYLHRSCLEAAIYMQDKRRMESAKGMYDEFLATAVRSGKRLQYARVPSVRVA